MARIPNPPDAASMMTAARSFGNYDLAGALADLIDNSITAKASKVEINSDYGNSENCILRIRDNGTGMDSEGLKAAMRPASQNPEDERSVDDLGRFGWGLKSASFSQCRILTVITSKNGITTGARWNLDDCDNWNMDIFNTKESIALLSEPFEGDGTEVIWENCDRLTEYNEIDEDRFNELTYSAMKKLSLTFHRYLFSEINKKSIELFFNGNLIKAQDPFLKSHEATGPNPPETVIVNGSIIKMQAFTLPHYSHLKATEHKQAAGEEGYVKNQGFYVYRNRRLIIHGTWFGLAKHGELSKLVRIQIDIPNSLDDIWKITVDKSDAQLPSVLIKRMKQLIEGYRVSSSRVVNRTSIKLKNRRGDVWEKKLKEKSIYYKINKKHIVLQRFKKNLNRDDIDELDDFLHLLEIQLPYDEIALHINKSPHSVIRGHSNRGEAYDFIDRIIRRIVPDFKTASDLLNYISQEEIFPDQEKIVQEVVQNIYNELS